MEQHLQALVSQWEQRARRKFADAEREGDPAGRRLVEHGAMCYVNAAVELKVAIQRACGEGIEMTETTGYVRNCDFPAALDGTPPAFTIGCDGSITPRLDGYVIVKKERIADLDAFYAGLLPVMGCDTPSHPPV